LVRGAPEQCNPDFAKPNQPPQQFNRIRLHPGQLALDYPGIEKYPHNYLKKTRQTTQTLTQTRSAQFFTTHIRYSMDLVNHD
jgi:hypothetical protein